MQIDEELTLKKLEVFLAFMRSGNLGKAAVELNTSNVSVHRAIHSLESALRCPLFKHEGRNLIPLESAYVLEERAQQLVKDVLETVRRTREAAGFSAERFKLGALYSLTVKTVPQLIMGLKLRRSELNIDLILGSNVDLLYKLKNMELDAILVSLNESVADPDCAQVQLFSDDIFLAAPADSPFANQSEVDLSDLRDATFITLSQGFATVPRLRHPSGRQPSVPASGFRAEGGDAGERHLHAAQHGQFRGRLRAAAGAGGHGLRIAGAIDTAAGALSPAAAHRRGVSKGQGARPEPAGAARRMPDVCPARAGAERGCQA